MRLQLSSALIPEDLPQLKTILLENRGITDADEFFEPTHPDLLNLEAVGISSRELAKALQLLQDALINKKRVLVFGDYDADGISATAVLWLALNQAGFNAVPFIPDRQRHGYGLSEAAIAEILSSDTPPELVVTVDNGIVAHQAVERLESAGITVIVTDHHQPEKDSTGEIILPAASAVVQTTSLCGATVAWILARELGEALQLDLSSQTLDLCGIATIADQVPLTTVNRNFAWHGIRALQTTTRPGLLALLEGARTPQSELNSSTIHFSLAPRINAMGRLEHGLDALRLLCTTNQQRAAQLASVLHDTNQRRQEVTIEQFEDARQQALRQSSEHLLVVYSKDYHEGVIGLIAGRLTDEFSKPSIVISIGSQTSKASARSLPGINIVELIREIRDDLLEVGGHPMAAGFGFLSDKLETVQARLHTLAKEVIAAASLEIVQTADCQLPVHLLDLETVELLERFHPCGQKNPEPLFLIKDCLIEGYDLIGKDRKHLKIWIQDTSGSLPHSLPALGWNMAGELARISTSALEHQPLSLVVSLEKNTWRGKDKVQLRLVNILTTQV